MDILVNVANQKLKIATNLKSLVAGTQNFIRFVFNLPGDWDGLLTFAQFTQEGVSYNQYLDENNCAYLPAEIGVGTCTMMLFGSNQSTIATTNYITLTIDANYLVADANSTEITQSLYTQLVTRVNTLLTWNEQNAADLIKTDRSLQQQINQKANSDDLVNEIATARAAERANANAISLKADQTDLDELSIKVTQLEQNEVIANLIEQTVSNEMQTFLNNGTLASMTIPDGSITKAKVDSDFTDTLNKAESAMQPSVYDVLGRKRDVFEYARAQADAVQYNLDTLKTEIQDAYWLSGTKENPEVAYQNLGDALRGTIALSRIYAQAMLADYKAFTITIVDSLPLIGEAQTFYLLPNSQNTGYDKWWWITDPTTGLSKWDCFGSASTIVVTELPETGEDEVDYILKSNAGCLFYKWIDGEWNVVAGSIASVASTLPESGNEFTDYYVLNNAGVYLHYRWINGAFHSIGSDTYSQGELDVLLSNMQDDIDKNEHDIETNKINISSLSRTVDRIRSDLDGLDTEGYTYYHTITKDDNENNVLTLWQVHGSDEEIASQTILPSTGGGGSGTPSSSTTMSVDRVTASPLIITTNDSAIVEIDFSSLDGDGETVDGVYTWRIGSNTIMSGPLVQGRNSFDLSSYVPVGTQKFTLIVSDTGGSTVVKSWTIQRVDIRIESSFSDRYTTPIGRNVAFTYTPYGAVNKTVHFKLDGVETTTTTSASGTLQSYTVDAQQHGSHLLEVWITATVNNINIETNHIYKDIIWYDSEKDNNGDYNEAVIGCIYRYDYYGTVNARQYNTTAIAYNVFDPTTSYPVVKRYIDDVLVDTSTLTASANVWNYKSDSIGVHVLRIVCRNTTVTIRMNITELGIDVSPITGGLEVDFNPTGVTNSSDNRLWSNGTYQMSVSENFDWANGGYKTDENGDSYFLVKAGTRATLNYKMFGGGINSNPSVVGAEMKIVFMTENVQDAEAIWLSNAETTTVEVEGQTTITNVGIQMGVHNGWLKTNTASDTDVKDGEGEDADTVAATNTYLYMPYSEEDIIEMDINIDTLDREDVTAKAFVMAYEDGVPSKAFVYDSSDRFYQYDPKDLVIGSDYCDVRIYRLKIYSTSLTTTGIMRNFIADSRNSDTMLARYDRNSIYYNRETNTYTPYSGEGELDPERLAQVVPNVKILMLDTDHFTTSKKTFVKSTLRCIHASGGDLYEGDPYYDNWYFENGYHSGQGTTSDNYGNAGRNVDFLFNSDGVHKPSDKVNAEAGYVSQVTLGYNTENATVERVTDWKGDSGKITLTRTSIPNNFFNLKVNIASSENVNNALLQKRYNDYLPYISPAKARDARTKNDMEFVPAILFIRENNPDVSTHNEFLDTEWHFYAIGNIGDSKKTDYTRAYDPDDMNEFTIEISDNTKNNATFQTGVFLDSNNNRKVESFTIAEDGSPVSVDKPQAFVYPITMSEWENENNMRRWALYNEDFDGDHSFEPRYACCGDYRDGKLVNDTTGNGKQQVKVNNEVWRAFYRWVVTSTDQQFVNELDEWVVRPAVEFFYAFTHMYTMMDNRAKNTFWHFAKTGVYRQISRPVPELLHVYSELVNDEYVSTEDTAIVSGKTYYTQYAFDLWCYDTDTGLGINNNGELVFPYGKEDTDYSIEGNPSSGYVFNGATSVFWCRLRDLLPDEIRTMFNTTVAADCFSAVSLINQFDAFQECYPEEIWRLDIQRKYIRTFTGDSVDNSKPKHDVQYLRDMMQGRKKYQRRQWVRDQEMYFGTKNLMNTVVGDDNRITFRCYTPTGDDIVVPPDYTLHIKPYSDMYLSVMFGNGGVQQVRAKGGVEYTIQCPLSTMDDTQVTIYGANRIQELNDLSACYIAANNFSMASRLRKLVLGNTTPGYNNAKLVSLTLGNNKLLEELDIRNCANLTGALNLSQSSNLLKLYAEGTKISGVTFATNGKVRLAHLPATINTLTMRNLNDLNDFVADTSHLETLTLQGGKVDSKNIVIDALSTLQVLYLYDIDWELADTSVLNAMTNMFYSLVTGSVYVSGPIRLQEISTYNSKWSDLTVTYNTANLVTQYLATYVNANGDILYTTYVDRGANPPDPVVDGLIDTPTQESTAQYDFTFSGWDTVESPMLNARTITATYTESIRTYTVRWYSRPGLLLKSVQATFGSEVNYGDDFPTNTSEEGSYIYNVFAGWDKSTGFIRGNTDVYALWDRAELPASSKDLKDMSCAEIYAVSANSKAGEYFEDKDYFDLTLGSDFDFSNVESRTILQNRFFDGTEALDTNIKLFNADALSFTLAIDYEFIDGNDTNATLVSCFEETGSEGIRLRYNTGPNIQWGDKTLAVGKTYNRNIVVIRHQKGSRTIFVYGFNNGDTTYDLTGITGELVRTINTETDSILTFGAVRYLGDGGYDYYGKGWIHWCKVWYDDLGVEVAQKLAAWPHETLRMEFTGADRYRLAGTTSLKANCSFLSNSSLPLLRRMNPTNSNVGGWDQSEERTFLNTRFYEALAYKWQAAIKQVKISATAGNQVNTIVVSNDYIYHASNSEVGGNQTEPYLSEGSRISFFTTDRSRLKFTGVIIPEDAQFISGDTEPTLLSGYSVKEGDVWIKTDNSNVGYIYLSAETIAKHSRVGYRDVTNADNIQASDGGCWHRANNWWERSPYVSHSTSFYNVHPYGYPNHYSYPASTTIGCVPGFSI